MKKLFFIVAVIAIATMIQSCGNTGYGCKGTGKRITRVPGNGY